MKPLYSVLACGTMLLTAALASAQRPQPLANFGSGGFGLNSTYARLYNPATVVTFRGKINGVSVASPINGVGNSVRIIVRARNGGSSLVELGPQWFVNHQDVKLNLGDNVTVTGSKVVLDGRGSIMARRVVVGRKALVLRDLKGDPYWAANSPAIGPAFVTSGSAAQEMAIIQAPPSTQPVTQGTTTTAPAPIPTKPVPVLPYNAPNYAYMSPSVATAVIDHFTNDNGNIFMILNMGGALRTVYLAPAWYIQNQDAVLNPGDTIFATLFVPINDPNGTAYAQSITDNGQTMTFRNAAGETTWAPWFANTYNP